MQLYKVIEYPTAYGFNLRKGSMAYYTPYMVKLCKLFYPIEAYEELHENI